MKVNLIYTAENPPYPNNTLPVLHYRNALKEVFLEDPYQSEDVLKLFKQNAYGNGWVNGIFDQHHYHSNTHEALACTKGDAMVQLGGPNGEILKFVKGDVILLPTGVAHKRLEQSTDFEVVGAYPEGRDYNFIEGEVEDYQVILAQIADVPLPLTDPVVGSPGHVDEHWNN